MADIFGICHFLCIFADVKDQIYGRCTDIGYNSRLSIKRDRPYEKG